MLRICPWCTAPKHDPSKNPKLPQPKGGVTHTICKSCYDKVLKDYEAQQAAKAQASKSSK